VTNPNHDAQSLSQKSFLRKLSVVGSSNCVRPWSDVRCAILARSEFRQTCFTGCGSQGDSGSPYLHPRLMPHWNLMEPVRSVPLYSDSVPDLATQRRLCVLARLFVPARVTAVRVLCLFATLADHLRTT
jgi:hypothetical protein